MVALGSATLLPSTGSAKPVSPGTASNGDTITTEFDREGYLEVFRDIRDFLKSYPEAKVLPSDDPCRRRLGYGATVQDSRGTLRQVFSWIPLGNCSASDSKFFEGFDLRASNILRELLKTQEGRLAIAEGIKGGSEIWLEVLYNRYLRSLG